MSDYLIQRMSASRLISMHPSAEIDSLHGDTHLERLTWVDSLKGTRQTRVGRNMFVLLHRRIEATEPSFEEWAAAAGIPAEEEQRQGMKKLDDYYGKSPLGGNSLVLQAIRQQKPTSLRQYIESLAR